MLNFTGRKQIDSIINHAKEEYPYECCGIIAGKGKEVRHVIKMENTARSSVEYKMDDTTLKNVFDELDEAGLDFIGVYHSHPTGVAYPSAVDIERSIFPEVDYLIVSISKSGEHVIKNFKIIKNDVKEEPYIISNKS